MTALLTVLIAIARTLLYVVSFALLMRAILSWLPIDDDNPLLLALCMVTEPIILPIRALCARFGWFQGTPLDMPFLLTMVMLSFVGIFLQAALL